MSDSEVTKIQLKKSVVRALKEVYKYPRETCDETIRGLMEFRRSIGGKDPYDKFDLKALISQDMGDIVHLVKLRFG